MPMPVVLLRYVVKALEKVPLSGNRDRDSKDRVCWDTDRCCRTAFFSQLGNRGYLPKR